MSLFRIAEEAAADSIGRRHPYLFTVLRVVRKVGPVALIVAGLVAAWFVLARLPVRVPSVDAGWVVGGLVFAACMGALVAAARRWGDDIWWRVRSRTRW